MNISQEQLEQYHIESIFIYDVIDILEEHFGSERIDYTSVSSRRRLQYSDEYSIIIHYPEVRVTNEYDRYVDIQDLYIRFKVRGNGTYVGSGNYSMEMVRSTFNSEQFLSGYTHSHIPSDSTGKWNNPCFGRGPIVDTQVQLNSIFDDMLWGIFCNELDTWTEVESIAGHPHHRMESIGTNNNQYPLTLNREAWARDSNFTFNNSNLTSAAVLTELVKEDIRFCYNEGWDLGISDTKFALLASNAALRVINRLSTVDQAEAVRYNFKTCIMADGQYKILTNNNMISLITNNPVILKFNGQEIRLRITNGLPDSVRNNVRILEPSRLSALYKQLIIIVNSLYGKPVVGRRTRVL